MTEIVWHDLKHKSSPEVRARLKKGAHVELERGKWSEIGRIDCVDSVGTATIFECQECFALVHYSTRTQHEKWHERLRGTGVPMQKTGK